MVTLLIKFLFFRLVSSDDTGKDESNVQTLLKKHKEITDELKNYQSTIDALHEQAEALGEDDRESRTVNERLNSIDKRYQELQELARLRKQRLLDALSLYKLFTEADGVEQWINEKEKMLVTMVPGKGLLLKFFREIVTDEWISRNFQEINSCYNYFTGYFLEKLQ